VDSLRNELKSDIARVDEKLSSKIESVDEKVSSFAKQTDLVKEVERLKVEVAFLKEGK
jgi:polyhydroxyalkanoate synthesis regulator phasin